MNTNAITQDSSNLSGWAAWFDARMARLFELLERSYMTRGQ